MKNLLERIKREEGFRALPYLDTLGFKTVGYGFKLPLSKAEQEISIELGFSEIYPMSKKVAEAILLHRLENIQKRLYEQIVWLKFKPQEVQNILIEMAYQLGANGVVKFKNTLKMIENNEYEKASKGMLQSLWAKQTPNRAKRLSKRMAKVSADF